MQYIHREIEPLIKKVVQQFPAIVITGPRQAGKSTLLKNLFGQTYQYFTFDDPVIRQQAISDPRLFLESGGGRMIIDEIQYVPELLSYVKMAIDSDRDQRGKFIMTGSQQFSLMKNLSDSLAGRVAILELLPFSALEKFSFQKKASFSTKDFFVDACKRGSFPELVLKEDIDVLFWYASYVQTYLERDIRTLYDIGNIRDFQRFFHILAARCSQTLNLSELSNELDIAVNTVKRWVSILEAGRIIYLLPPFYRNFGKRIVKRPKLYFTDLGMVCYLLAMLRDEQHLLTGPLAGALFENFCIQETLKHNAHQAKSHGLYYLRTHNGLEIDLLVERDGVLFPVEFKLSKTPTSLMGAPIAKIREIFPKLPIKEGRIVSLYDKYMPLNRELKVSGMKDFLEWL